MEAGKLIGLGLVGVAGYFVYKNYAGVADSSPASAPASATSIAPSGVVSDATLLAGFNTAIVDAAKLPPDQFNRVIQQWDVAPSGYQAATRIAPNTLAAIVLGIGAAGTTGQQSKGTDSKTYSFDGQYWNRLSGLGMLINLNNLSQKNGWGCSEFGYKPNNNGLNGIVDDPANSAAYIDEAPFIEAVQSSGSSFDSGIQGFIDATKG